MKTLVMSNQKGGVGKSAVGSQLAFYAAHLLNLRTLYIDLDHQGNSSKVLKNSNLAEIAPFTASSVVKDKGLMCESAKLLLIHSDQDLLKLEQRKDEHNLFATNLNNFLKSVDEKFDLCIIDTNPNPDIRLTAALVVSGFVLSPIQLNQEAIDGIGALYRDITKVKTHLNKNLSFLGILPNLVEGTPFQRTNLAQIAQAYGKIMITLENGQVAAIPTRTAVAEAQAAAKPIWKLGKSSAREAWTVIKPIFDKVINEMGLGGNNA